MSVVLFFFLNLILSFLTSLSPDNRRVKLHLFFLNKLVFLSIFLVSYLYRDVLL